MKAYKFIAGAMVIASLLCSCKDSQNRPEAQAMNAPAATSPIDTAAILAADWDRFKLQSEQRIAEIEDSLSLYDMKIRNATATNRATRNDVRERVIALHRRLAQRDEAQGSMKRAGEAITRGIDTLGQKVTHLFSKE
jgi:hypothetical protein